MNSEFDVVVATPDLAACVPFEMDESVKDKVVLITRGPSFINKTENDRPLGCRFTTKVFNAQLAGAKGVIIGNNVGMHDIVPMYKDDQDLDMIRIPSVSVSRNTFQTLFKAVSNGESVK